MSKEERSQYIARELAKAISASNAEAFKLLYTAEYENVKYFVRSFTHDSVAAEDIAQESFIAFWNNRATLNPEQNIRSYLFTTARNKTLNYLKLAANRLCDPLLAEEYAISEAAITSPDIDSKIDSLSMERIISLAYEKLPDPARTIFRLSREEQMTYEQISEKLGIPVKAVEYNISKSLKFFKRRIKIFTNN